MQPGVGNGEGRGVVWAVRARGGVWARIGSLFLLSKHLGNASQVWVMARPGWDGVWAVGVVRARGGVGTHWQPFYTF